MATSESVDDTITAQLPQYHALNHGYGTANNTSIKDKNLYHFLI